MEKIYCVNWCKFFKLKERKKTLENFYFKGFFLCKKYGGE
ncbi:hypothetical protein BBROOKSOX_1296 [Bathymodiolus brooksi thiotrophic gill symbiont]|nr:hypothetical protein BBROOKSOX_1296 [Bathymodiolus brooksi thiotrophic gill symbiont]